MVDAGLNSMTGHRELRIFVDDVSIARQEGLVRRVRAGGKLPAPVLSGAEPWERPDVDTRVYVYGTVLPDPGDGSYRMWYMRNPNRVLYATSRDGLSWQRPALGLELADGSPDTNQLAISLHSPSVIRDEGEADPDKRYKMLGCATLPGGRGYCAAHSGDGLRWELYDGNPVLAGSDTCTLAQDPITREYLAFHKLTHEHGGHVRRLVYLSLSEDMQEWSEPKLVLAPDEIDDGQTQGRGGICSEFYNMSAFPYAGQWLGLVTHFQHTGTPVQKGPEQSPNDGPIDVQLVHSRDGRRWHRCEDRSPLIANGPHGYDAGCILGVTNSPVMAGDEMCIYYSAITTTHGGCLPQKVVTIARAAWPRDRWVALEAGPDGGNLEMVPEHLQVGCLEVNAAASEGQIRAELADAEGAVLPGYAYNDCEPICGDGLRQPVRWGERDRLPKVESVRVRLRLASASLYSYRVS